MNVSHNFKHSDFRKMRWPAYNCANIEQLKILNDVPEAKQLSAYQFQILKYMVFMYDAGSPLGERIQSITERKELAFRMAGFDNTEVSQQDIKASLFKLRTAAYRKILSRMLRVQHNLKLSLLVAMEQTFWQCFDAAITEVVMDETTDPKKYIDSINARDKTMSLMFDLERKIAALSASVYIDGDDPANEVVKEILAWSPEGISE